MRRNMSYRVACCLFVAVLTVGQAALLAQSDSVQLGAVHWDDAYQRWRDIATNPYDSDKVASYVQGDGYVTLYDDAQATLTYEATAPTLIGQLVASGLKPNCAYQIKLNGKPTYNWGPAGDDLANEELGYAGRWWVNKVAPDGSVVGGWNSDDAEYESSKAVGFTDGVYDYVFEGYLLFDYVVTDKNGNASKALALDSSFHVLWKTSQRQPQAEDSAATDYSVVANGKTSDWYSRRYRTQTIGIYAEWEPGRDLPGECLLPLGLYNVRMFLTEESFHEDRPDSGSWATVLTCDHLVFAVDDVQPPPVAMHIASIDMALKKAGPNTGALATVTIVDEDGFPVEGATVSGAWSDATNDSDSGTTDTTGRVTLASDKIKKPALGTTFTFTVTNVDKTGCTYESAENVETSDSISTP